MAEKMEYDIIVNGKSAKKSIEEVEKSQNKLDKTVTKSANLIKSNWLSIGASIAVVGASLVGMTRSAAQQEQALFGLNDSLKEYATQTAIVNGLQVEMVAGFLRSAQTADLNESTMKRLTEQAIALGRAYPHESMETLLDNLIMLNTTGEAQGFVVDILEQKYRTLDSQSLSLADKLSAIDEVAGGVNEKFNAMASSKIDTIIAALGQGLNNVGQYLINIANNSGALTTIIDALKNIGLISKDRIELEKELSDINDKIAEKEDKLLTLTNKRAIATVTRQKAELENNKKEIQDKIRLITETEKLATAEEKLKNKQKQKEEQAIKNAEAYDYETERLFEELDKQEKAIYDYSEAQVAAQQRVVNSMQDSVVNGFTNSIIEAAKTGKVSFKDMASSMIEDISRIIIRLQLMYAITSGARGFDFASGTAGTTASPSQKGAVVSGGVKQRFEKGGITTQPTMFGNTLIGEAGQEGVFPLTRTANGDLGVKAEMGGIGGNTQNVNVAINIYAQDTQSGTEFLLSQKPTIQNMMLEGITTNTNIKRSIKNV